MKRLWLIAVMILPAALAAAPGTDDYARGVLIEAPSGKPLVEVVVPDEVYQTVRYTDLSDLRVFNASGMPVPHAFCAAVETAAPIVAEQSLPVFELRAAENSANGSSRIQVHTAGGTQVNVEEAATDGSLPARAGTHIIDARGIETQLRALQFDWQSPDQSSTAQVRIEASEDLDRWQEIVAESTLLKATQGGQELKRERIELPQRRYHYLRVQRTDGGPPLRINAATAEHISHGADIEPLWFMANAMVSAESNSLLFDAARHAPVRFARLRLPQENSSVRVTLQSRDADNSAWRDRWSGEIYLIVTDTERRESPPARFDATTDRYWRAQMPPGNELHQVPTLELGYRPMRLRFLAQGAGPYTAAFGSERAARTPAAACDSLLADVGPDDRARMIAEGYVTNTRELGGPSAFKPLPQKTPLRLVVLWSVLIAGVALLVIMALSLLKRVRTGSP